MSWQQLSISRLSQLLLTRFWWNFEGKFLGTFRTDSNCHRDIFPVNYNFKLNWDWHSSAPACFPFILYFPYISAIPYSPYIAKLSPAQSNSNSVGWAEIALISTFSHLPQKILSKLFFRKKYGSKIPYLHTVWTYIQTPKLVFSIQSMVGLNNYNVVSMNILFSRHNLVQ